MNRSEKILLSEKDGINEAYSIFHIYATEQRTVEK